MSIYDAATIKKQIIGGAVAAFAAYGTAAYFGIDPVVATIAVATYKIGGIILNPILQKIITHQFPNTRSNDAKERSRNTSEFFFASGTSTVIIHSGLTKLTQYVTGRLGKNSLFSQVYVIGPAYCLTIGSLAEYLASYYIY